MRDCDHGRRITYRLPVLFIRFKPIDVRVDHYIENGKGSEKGRERKKGKGATRVLLSSTYIPAHYRVPYRCSICRAADSGQRDAAVRSLPVDCRDNDKSYHHRHRQLLSRRHRYSRRSADSAPGTQTTSHHRLRRLTADGDVAARQANTLHTVILLLTYSLYLAYE